jgi:hypothetical protein
MTDAYGTLVGEANNIIGRKDCPIVTLHYQISRIGSNPCFHSEKVASGWPGTWQGAPAICIVTLVSINIANVWKTAVLTAVGTV